MRPLIFLQRLLARRGDQDFAERARRDQQRVRFLYGLFAANAVRLASRIENKAEWSSTIIVLSGGKAAVVVQEIGGARGVGSVERDLPFKAAGEGIQNGT